MSEQPRAADASSDNSKPGKGPDPISPFSVERRALLFGAAAVAAGALSAPASAAPEAPQAPDLSAALAKFRATIPSHFDRAYVEHAVVPFFLGSIFAGERPILPMIDLPLTKQDAIPWDFWGMLYEDWKPTPSDGVTVFLEGLENRGPDNLRKRIYFAGVTPDLYAPKYQAKVVDFLDKLLDPQHADKPFMRHYLDDYWDIYWDLHLGVKGDAVPPQVRAIGEAFNTVLAYRNPLDEIVYENYMTVRALRPFLTRWIDERLEDIENGRIADPDKTIAYYWLKNAGDGKYFDKKDVVFECFHNFVALSQWGNSIFGVMSRLNENGGDPAVRAAFQKTMSGDFDNANGKPYTPLELLVMELFRTISPNGGSISAITDTRAGSFYGGSPFAQFGVPYERHSYMNTPHTETSFDTAAMAGAGPLRPRALSRCGDQRRDRRGEMQADRPAALPVRHHHAPGQRRAQDRHHQQRLRHRVRGDRRKAGAALRLCRIRAVRLRLPALPRRAIDDRRVRRFSPQGAPRQYHLPQSPSAESATGSGRAGRGDRRRHRLLEAGVSVTRPARALRIGRARLRET